VPTQRGEQQLTKMMTSQAEELDRKPHTIEVACDIVTQAQLSRVQTHKNKLKLLFPGGAVAPPDPPFMSAYRPPGLLAGWLACWLAGLLACWLAGLLAGWLAGWLACLLACWLASWLAGLLACWLAGLLACWLAGLLACLLAGLLAF